MPQNFEYDKVIGYSGTEISNGYITEDYLTQFNGREKYDILDKMRRDDKCSAALNSIKSPIIGSEIYLESIEDENGTIDSQDEELEDLFEGVLFGNNEYSMKKPFAQYLKEILTCLDYGFSVFEIIFRKTDKGILPYDLMYLKQSTVDKWEMDNGEPGITQVLKSKATYGENKGLTRIQIPADKLIVFTYDKEGDNFEGNSILRSAYRAWKQKDNLQKYQMRIAEKYAGGIIQGWTPTNASEDDKIQYSKNLAKISSSRTNIVVHPGSKEEGWEFEFVDPKIPSGVKFEEMIDYQDKAIANATMTVFLNTSNSSSVGSNARAKTEMDFFLIGVNSLLWYVCDTLNNNLIKKTCEINSWDNAPVLTFKDIELDKDLGAVATAYKTLVDSGIVTPDRKLEEFTRKGFELPEIDDESREQIQETRTPNEPAQEPQEPDQEEDAGFSYSSIIEAQLGEQEPKTSIYYKHDSKHFSQFQRLKYEEKMNPEEIGRILDDAEEYLNTNMKQITNEQKRVIMSKLEKSLKDNTLDYLDITFSISALSQLLTSIGKDMFEVGKKSVSEELGADATPTKSEVKGLIRGQNDEYMNLYRAAIVSGLTGFVTQQIAARGGDIKLTPVNEVLNQASKLYDTITERYTNGAFTNNVTGMMNAGRTAAMEVNKGDIYAVQYSAILDSRTTPRCRDLNGRVVEYGSQDYYAYSPPGHYGCRSLWVIISKKEVTDPTTGELYKDVPKVKNIPSSLQKTGPLSLMK